MRGLRLTCVVAALLAAMGELWALATMGAKLGGSGLSGSALTGAAAGLRTAFAAAPAQAAVAVAAAMLALVAVLLSLRLAGVDRALAAPAAPALPAPAAAIRLLGLLQSEGRFIDFLQEEIGRYDDGQVAAAARGIHEGCRRALFERMKLLPVLAGEEGEEVTVEEGFDPAAIRVTGNVRGNPPYRGVLRHPGWRSEGIRLAQELARTDPNIISPAEVEIV